MFLRHKNCFLVVDGLGSQIDELLLIETHENHANLSIQQRSVGDSIKNR